jgi:anti-anti-sigma factor
MATTLTQYDNVGVLTIREELAGDNVEAFAARARECLGQSRYHLVIDCSAVEGLDSAGLEALLDIQDECERNLGGAKLCGLSEVCAKILEITRLARRFETFEDLDAAVKSFE